MEDCRERQFGPKEEDNFIQNIQTAKKVMLRKKGGSYVMPVEFMMDACFQRQP